MSYSVIQIGPVTNDSGYGLYDSRLQACIFSGTQDEMFAIKHKIESQEQAHDNQQHMNSLRKEWLDILIKSDKTPEEAEQFLKTKMPYLYGNH